MFNDSHHGWAHWLVAGLCSVGFALSANTLADDRCPATGGIESVESVDGQLSCIHRFTTVGSSTFEVPVGSLNVEVLVVGGGGAGGQAESGGGGGGAGGLSYQTSISATGSVVVEVGAGGSGVGTGGQNGSPSSFGDIVGLGGGGGSAGDNLSGQDGGSGGGGSGGDNKTAIDTPGSATQLPEFGHDGGVGALDRKVEKRAGGGGGGASAVGEAGDAKKDGGIGGPGGPGLCAGGSVLPSWMAGLGDDCFAGGGGGSAHENSVHIDRAGAGGIGGGGTGEEPIVGGLTSPATSGLPNSGGGGGGSRNGAPGAGGSGVVLVRYLAATTMTVEQGNDQTATVTEAVSVAPSVRITNANGDPIGGVPVSFVVTSGEGSIDPTESVLTNALGVASLNTWVLGASAGNQSLTVTGTGLSGSPLTINATAVAGPAGGLSVVTQPPGFIINGEIFETSPVIQLVDAYGNAAAESGRPVTASLDFGSGVLSGTVSVNTNDSGQAAFADLMITGLVGPKVLGFASSGLSSVQSNTFSLKAGAPVGLIITRQPSSEVQEDEVFPEQPKIQLIDESGNAVSQAGIDVTASLVSGPTGALAGSPVVSTDAAGEATYTDLEIIGLIGTYRLGFTASGLSSIESQDIQVNAGAPTTLAIAQQPSAEAQNDVVFDQQPIIQLRDSAGNPAPISGVSVSVSLASGAETLAGTLVSVTNSQGQAVFTDLEIIGVAGDRTLQFSAPDYASVTSDVIAVSCGRCEKLAMLVQPVGGPSGETLSVAPVVGQFDSAGNPTTTVRAITVSLASGSGTLSGTTTVNSSGGQATFDDLVISGTAGDYVLAFTSEPLIGAQSDAFGVAAGAPSVLSVYAGNDQRATVGDDVAIAPSVQVVDAWNNPISGVALDYAVLSGGGSISPTTVVTNSAGLATLDRWTLGTSAGENILEATSAALPGATVSWSATGVADVPVGLMKNAGDGQTADAGEVVPIAPSVKVVDQFDNPVSGIEVTFSVTAGGGSLLSPMALTDINGVATVSQWQLGVIPGVNTLSATIDGIGSAVTFSATAVVGPPAQLVIVTQPVAAGSGQLLTTQPVVHITDQVGNVTNSTEPITATLTFEGENGIPAALSGTRTVSAVAGIVNFTDLVLTGPVGVDYELEFSNETLSLVTSDVMSLSPGLPEALRLQQQPSAFVTHGEVFATPPILEVIDGAGNVVPIANTAITAAVVSGGGNLNGSVTRTTNASGQAVFADLSLVGLVGQYTLRFDASNLTGIVSNTLTLTPGQASGLSVVRQPSSQVQNGVVFAEQPQVQVVDASGNAVSVGGVPISVTAIIAETQSAVVEGDVVVETDETGLATFSDLKMTGTVGAYRLSFSAPNLTITSGEVFELNAGPPKTLTIVQQPSAESKEDLVFAKQPIIALRDESGNAAAVAGVVVTVAIGQGEPTLKGTLSVATDAQGQAVFTDLAIQGVVGTRTLRFIADGYASITSDLIEITCGRCEKLAMDRQPVDAISGEVFPVAPIVGQYDNAGNRTSTVRTITASLASGPGQLSGTTSVSSVDGQAIFTDLVIEGAEGPYALLFESTNLDAVVSDVFTVEVVEPSYEMVTEVNPTNAGSLVCDPNPVIEGETTVCTATPNEAYDFERFAVCDGVVADNTCTLSRVGEEKTVRAVFVLKPLPVPTLSIGMWAALMLILWAALQLIACRQSVMGASHDSKGGS